MWLWIGWSGWKWSLVWLAIHPVWALSPQGALVWPEADLPHEGPSQGSSCSPHHHPLHWKWRIEAFRWWPSSSADVQSEAGWSHSRCEMTRKQRVASLGYKRPVHYTMLNKHSCIFFRNIWLWKLWFIYQNHFRCFTHISGEPTSQLRSRDFRPLRLSIRSPPSSLRLRLVGGGVRFSSCKERRSILLYTWKRQTDR